MYIMFHYEDIYAVKLLSSCEVVEIGCFWAPDLQWEGIPHILDIHFKVALTSEYVVGFG